MGVGIPTRVDHLPIASTLPAQVDVKPVFLSMRVQARVLSTEQFKETQLEDMHGAWFPALTLQQQHVEGPYPALPAPVVETLTNRPASRVPFDPNMVPWAPTHTYFTLFLVTDVTPRLPVRRG